MTFRRLIPAFIFVATLLTLLLGFRAAPLSLATPVDTPAAEAYLRGFRGLERNQSNAYRWSLSQSSLNLNAFAHSPVIIDLRLTSPRPADAAPADLMLTRGPWNSGRFDIRGDWRRYQVLLPASGNQPEVMLASTSFRPAERDQRSLGVALSRLHFSSIKPASALNLVSPWRLMLLLILPLVLYSLSLGLFSLRFLEESATVPLLAAVPALLSLTIVWSQASETLATALLIPDSWMPALLFTALGLAWASQRSTTRPAEQFALRLLNTDRTRLTIILGAALLLGIAMVVRIPPWEQYDESAHFEFAWLIANHPSWPVPGTSDPRLAAIGGGGRALFHQPLYYIIASVPLRLASELSLINQMYLVRSLSLLLFLATIAMAERTARIIFPPSHPMRWLAPLALALNPTFAALMTSVSNDVAATTACTLAVLLSAQTLVYGLTTRRVLLLLASIPLAIMCKNTGAVVAGLVPLVLIVAFWAQRGWRWRWLLSASLIIAIAPLPFILSWGEPGHWYRWGSTLQGPVARIEQPAAPVGPHALRLQAVPVPNYEGISTPVVLGSQITSSKITIGAWVWASRPATIWAPGVIFQTRDVPLIGDYRTVSVDTTPRFVAFQYDTPPRIMYTLAMAWSVAPDDTQPLEIYVDGLVLANGAYPTDTMPQYSGTGLQAGSWGGQPFTNLIRNGDIEQGWVYLTPTAERLIARFARRSPSRIVASFYDLPTTLRLELSDYLPWMVFNSYGSYGWRIILRDQIWQYLLPGFALACTIGALTGIRYLKRMLAAPRIALITLSLASLGVWAVILIAQLPVNFPFSIPVPRYGFTMLAPTTLVASAGWLALWPKRSRRIAAVLLISGLIVLDITALTTIELFQNTSCITNTARCTFSPAPSLLSLLTS